VTEGYTEVIASWKSETTFLGETTDGGTIQMGTSAAKPGVSPMQLLLMSLAGCTGMDIVSILQKKHLKLDNLQILVRGIRSTVYPKIWTDIHITYLIWGEHLPARDVEHAIQLSEEKYCSVGLMLCKVANITSEYHLLEPGETANKGVWNERTD
jgi:putative redox protein